MGAHVVRKLVDRGDRVFVFVRPTSNISLIQRLPVDFLVGDISNFDSVLAVLPRVDELYHVAADYRLWAPDPTAIYRNNVEGTLNIMEAALRMDVPRVIYTSTVGCLGIPENGAPGDERTPVKRGDLIGHYKKSKFDAEQIALEYSRKGLDVVIVNPSTPVGCGDIKPTPTGKIIVDFLRGRMRAYVETGLNLIDVDDVAVGHLAAAARGVNGEKYILGNRNMTLKDIFDILAKITGIKAPKIRIPHSIAIGAAIFDSTTATILGRTPEIPIEGVLMSRKKMFFSADKAVGKLDLPQSPVEDALEAAVRWFDENGYTSV